MKPPRWGWGLIWGAAAGAGAAGLGALALRRTWGEAAALAVGGSLVGGTAGVLLARATYPELGEGPACPQGVPSVLIVGDSLAEGLAPHLKAHATACGAAWATSTKVGSGVLYWGRFDRIGVLLQTIKPTDVLFSLGGNDSQAKGTDVANAIDVFLFEVEKADARAWWIAPPEMPFDLDHVRALWEAKIGGEAWLDWFPADELEIPRAPDGIHPTPAAYKALASQIWKWWGGRREALADASAPHAIPPPPEGRPDPTRA